MAKVYVEDTSKSVSYTFATSIFFSIESRVEKKREILFLPTSHVWRFASVATTLRAKVQLSCTKP